MLGSLATTSDLISLSARCLDHSLPGFGEFAKYEPLRSLAAGSRDLGNLPSEPLRSLATGSDLSILPKNEPLRSLASGSEFGEFAYEHPYDRSL